MHKKVVNLGLALFTCLSMAFGQQKINPATQINWPAGCQVYNVALASCPPIGMHPADAVPGTTYTLGAAPKMMLGFYINGIFQRPGIEYTVAGSTVTLRTATTAGDYVYAYYV